MTAVAFRSLTVPILGALAVVLGLAVIARVRFDIAWTQIMGDPASAAGAPFYLGFVSNVGILLWAATASIFLFAWSLHRGQASEREWGRFLLCSGLLVGWLGLDDLFMLHDQVFPSYLSVPQVAVIAASGAAAALYLLRFARVMAARTAYPVFLAALGLLGLSLLLDHLSDYTSVHIPGSGLLEDGAKLLGVGTWLSYSIHTCAASLRER
jgi:hypothetical protein